MFTAKVQTSGSVCKMDLLCEAAADWMSDFAPTLPVNGMNNDICDDFQDDIRPRVKDSVTKQWLLIDSGAMVTVVTVLNVPRPTPRYRSEIKGSQWHRNKDIR